MAGTVGKRSQRQYSKRNRVSFSSHRLLFNLDCLNHFAQYFVNRLSAALGTGVVAVAIIGFINCFLTIPSLITTTLKFRSGVFGSCKYWKSIYTPSLIFFYACVDLLSNHTMNQMNYQCVKKNSFLGVHECIIRRIFLELCFGVQ